MRICRHASRIFFWLAQTLFAQQKNRLPHKYVPWLDSKLSSYVPVHANNVWQLCLWALHYGEFIMNNADMKNKTTKMEIECDTVAHCSSNICQTRTRR